MTATRAHSEKPPLVLLHGWGAHGGVWDDLAPRFHDHQAVTAPDLPGHGAVPPVAPYDMERVVDHLAAAAPAHCVVAGWSLGGQLALAWARRYPQQVRRLILIATTPRFVSSADWPHGLAPAVVAEFAAALACDAAATLRRFRLLETQGDARALAAARRMDAALAARPLPGGGVLEQTLRWLEEGDLRDALGGIAQPTLVLHGERDHIIPAAAGAFLAQQLPQASFRMIAGAAHAPFMTDPEAVCRLMSGFCDAQ
jgi:pimeloyl-[acyl-carrier protein] methyl ester esterase